MASLPVRTCAERNPSLHRHTLRRFPVNSSRAVSPTCMSQPRDALVSQSKEEQTLLLLRLSAPCIRMFEGGFHSTFLHEPTYSDREIAPETFGYRCSDGVGFDYVFASSSWHCRTRTELRKEIVGRPRRSKCSFQRQDLDAESY
jgi:hypothetical protein